MAPVGLPTAANAAPRRTTADGDDRLCARSQPIDRVCRRHWSAAARTDSGETARSRQRLIEHRAFDDEHERTEHVIGCALELRDVGVAAFQRKEG